MASKKLISLQDVKDHLKVSNDSEAQTEYELKGQNPSTIINHGLDKEYNILGMTPDEFVKERGSQAFDFGDFQRRFKKICDDYQCDLKPTTSSKAVEFCSKIIFEVGPESRKVKKNSGDKVWKFRFMYTTPENKLKVKTAFVCTFKAEGAENKQCDDEEKMVMSVKQAGMLAMDTFSKLVTFAFGQDPPIYLLTPLCGAIFSRVDVDVMAMGMNKKALPILLEMNASAQSGGHYLEYSTTTCAVVCSIIATEGLANKGKNRERKSVINKILKQYLSKKKDFNEQAFVVYAMYANGGLQAGASATDMIKFLESARAIEFKPVGARVARNLSDETEIKTLMKDYKSAGLTTVKTKDANGTTIFGYTKPPTPETVKLAGGIKGGMMTGGTSKTTLDEENGDE